MKQTDGTDDVMKSNEDHYRMKTFALRKDLATENVPAKHLQGARYLVNSRV